MSRTIWPQTKKPQEVRNIIISFSAKLDKDEFLSGTPTVSEIGTTDLTISDETVTVLNHTIGGLAIPSSAGVEFTVSGGVSREQYTIRVSVDTSLGQTLVEDVRLAIL
jgi:hypothetical protein